MKKFGFTLAEILITLGIIGVVAALTAPALVTNSGQSKIGPTLAKFVSTWEVASEQLMQENGISRYTNLTNDRPQILNLLSNYMVMSPMQNIGNFTYNNASGVSAAGQDGAYSTANTYQLKDGSTVAIFRSNGYVASGSYQGCVATLIYDINGRSGNNKIASEVFRFFVDDSGVLVPYGSNAHKFLDPNFNLECNPTSNNVNELWACTGAIADNGWKADY